MATTAIYIGIFGDVIALDRATGQQLWKAGLKGADFVNVLVDADRVIAATKGEVFCLDAATGHLLWRNELPGEGRGLVTLATALNSTGVAPSVRAKQVQDESVSAGAIVAATS